MSQVENLRPSRPSSNVMLLGVGQCGVVRGANMLRVFVLWRRDSA